MNGLGVTLDTIVTIFIVVSIIEFVAIILITYNVSKIKDVECKPFQNKRPDYPMKVLELLESILTTQQRQTDEIKKLKSQIETTQNNGVRPGMKSKEVIQLEEIATLQKQQITLLTKMVESTTGEEKKKLLEKWKQAAEIINNIDEN